MKIFSQLAALLLLVGYASGEIAAIRGSATVVSESTKDETNALVAEATVRTNTVYPLVGVT